MIVPKALSENTRRALQFLIVAGVILLAAFVGMRPSRYYLLLGVGGLGFLLLLQHPGLGLVAMAGLSFTLPLTFGTGSAVALTPPVFLIPVVAVAWLADGWRRRSVRLPASRTTLPLLLFVGSGLISLVAGNAYWDPQVPQPDNLLLVQMAQWAIYALSAVVFWVTGGLAARDADLRWLRRATWLFLGLAAVVVLETYLPPLQRLLGWSEWDMANRAMFWVWLPALAMGQLLFNRRLDWRVKLGLLVLLLAAAYYITFVRRTWSSGWVSYGVAALSVVYVWAWRRSKALTVALVVISVVLAVVLYPVLFAHAGGARELDLSWGGRKLLYQAVFDMVREHPILGLGPASYRHYGHTTWLAMGAGRALWIRPNISSHNNYIDIYAQQGLVGLALFLWFLVEVGLLALRLAARFRGDAAGGSEDGFAGKTAGFAAGYVHGVLGAMVATVVAMMLGDWLLPFVYNIGFPGFRTSALVWMFMGGLLAMEQLGCSQQPTDTE